MKIVLLGANGRTGREIINRALHEGDLVTALVRSKEKLADINHERLTTHVGNVCVPDAIASILPGHDAVISVLGPRWPFKSAAAIYPESAAAIVEAMQQSNVNRLLVTSSGLLFPDDNFMTNTLRRLVPNIVHGARQMEETIQASTLNWTFARTSFLTNDANMDYRFGINEMPKDRGAISRTAVASFLLQEAKQSNHQRQVIGLCG